MKKMNRIANVKLGKQVLLAVACMSLPMLSWASGPDGKKGKFINSTYDRLELKERRVMPYPPLREADVVYRQDVTRLIDIREKKNKPMNWPKNPLNEVLYKEIFPKERMGESAATGRIKVYKDEECTQVLNIGEIALIGGEKVTIEVQIGDDIYNTKDSVIYNPFEPSQIVKWQLNEQWIFDKQRGMFYPRIVSICPLYSYNIAGVEFTDVPMFYIKYDEVRQKLAQEDCYNRGNDGQRFTYYDWFESRMFSSYITKMSNEEDLAIKYQSDFKDNPLEALYESERLKQVMLDWEQDLWEY